MLFLPVLILSMIMLPIWIPMVLSVLLPSLLVLLLPLPVLLLGVIVLDLDLLVLLGRSRRGASGWVGRVVVGGA